MGCTFPQTLPYSSWKRVTLKVSLRAACTAIWKSGNREVVLIRGCLPNGCGSCFVLALFSHDATMLSRDCHENYLPGYAAIC
jgi:hypothetical protein